MAEDIMHLGLVDEGEIELDKAALEIAALDNAQADLARYLDLLDQITERLRAEAATATASAEQAARLAQVLATEFGFEGDRTTYDDPANADLIRVLDRRRGLPIALAILYVAMARRVGWTAHALNVPGHVLVGIGDTQPLVIDPFNGGVVLQPWQLRALVQTALGHQGAVGREHVAPMPNRAVLVRLMMNQATRAELAREADRALTVLRRITVVAPGYSFGWWERARLERGAGDIPAARMSLSSMLETTRDPALRTRVMGELAALAG